MGLHLPESSESEEEEAEFVPNTLQRSSMNLIQKKRRQQPAPKAAAKSRKVEGIAGRQELAKQESVKQEPAIAVKQEPGTGPLKRSPSARSAGQSGPSTPGAASAMTPPGAVRPFNSPANQEGQHASARMDVDAKTNLADAFDQVGDAAVASTIPTDKKTTYDRHMKALDLDLALAGKPTLSGTSSVKMPQAVYQARRFVRSQALQNWPDMVHALNMRIDLAEAAAALAPNEIANLSLEEILHHSRAVAEHTSIPLHVQAVAVSKRLSAVSGLLLDGLDYAPVQGDDESAIVDGLEDAVRNWWRILDLQAPKVPLLTPRFQEAPLLQL